MAMKTRRRKRQPVTEEHVGRDADHHLLLRPADARRRTGAARRLLGKQERAGPGADPPLPPPAPAPARRSSPGRWPSSSATTATDDARDVAAVRRLHDRYVHYKHRLASANIRLAAHVAKRFRHHALSYADLLQEAVCGLMQAIDRFDVSHGTRLATYATWWIRQTLQIAVARQSHLVSLSPHHLQELGLLQQESEALAHGGKHLPSPQELASRTGSSLEHLTHLQTATRTPGVAQRRPRRRQRLQADRGDAGQREHRRCGRTPSARKRSTS